MKLYNSIFINSKIEVKNRFVVSPMHSGFASDDHTFTEQAIAYYKRRAEGGFGLIITEFLCADIQGMSSLTEIGIYDDKYIPNLEKFTNAIHENDAKCFAQLHHGGIEASRKITDMDVVGPSKLLSRTSLEETRSLTVDEIQVIENKFAEAAIRAKKAGFDGVELHAAHGYLLAQFLSKMTNKRTDQYGGTFYGRSLIVCEIIRKVKDVCGTDFPVSVRISAEEYMEHGNHVEDAVIFSRMFEAAGADLIHVSSGSLFVGNSSGIVRANHARPGYNAEAARKIKQSVNIPVMVVGRINDPDVAERIIDDGCADFVVFGRQSIADPDFPKKVRENRREEIFYCTGCLQRCNRGGCEESDIGVSCLINPFSGKETYWKIEKAEEKKNIVIVGGGPAGLQAGWILAKKGHTVTLYEKETFLGGQYSLATIPPYKNVLGRTIATYEYLCQKYGVKIIRGEEVTGEKLKNFHVDIIILATGATPLIPKIPGINPECVVTAQEVLRGNKHYDGKKLLVIGAGLVGCETTQVLCTYGNQVDVVEMGSTYAPTMESRSPRIFLKEYLDRHGVRLYLNARVMKVCEDGVIYENKNGAAEELRGYDAVILALGARSSNLLESAARENIHEVYVIGDAKKAGDAKKCIYEATKLALSI